MAAKQFLNSDEFEVLRGWFASNGEVLPESVRTLFSRLIETYRGLSSSKKNQKKLLAELNQLMGLTPSSEKGSNEKHSYGPK